MNGIERIVAERRRQVNEEGWTAAHDAEWVNGELAYAAMCYAEVPEHRQYNDDDSPLWWPWRAGWWKPSPDRIRELEKAGALIAAEIDRLLREREAQAMTITQAEIASQEG